MADVRSWVALAFFVMSFSLSAQTNPEVVKKFKGEHIVPDVFGCAPSSLARVSYGELQVNLGTVLSPSSAQDAPSISFSADADSFYTLMLVDPDAPSRRNPIYRSWLHWLVVNIPGNYISDGEILAQYVGPTPPKNTGFHRYVFLVFEQPNGRTTFNEPKIGAEQTSPADRGNFSVRHFASKYYLGNPVAGNFFKAEFE